MTIFAAWKHAGWLLLALASCLSSAGCAMDELRGPAFPENEFGGNVRRADPEAKGAYGFSTKARQIESSLGVK